MTDSAIPPRLAEAGDMAAERAAGGSLPSLPGSANNALRNRSKVHPGHIPPPQNGNSVMYRDAEKNSQQESCCAKFLWVWIILVAILAMGFGFILGMLLEAKAIHAFEDDKDQVPKNAAHTGSGIPRSTRAPYELAWEPEYPRCPYGSRMAVSSGIDKRARPFALQLTRTDKEACGELCMELKTCIKSIYRLATQTCYVETSEKLNCADPSHTEKEPLCSSSSDCHSYMKMCSCPEGMVEKSPVKTELTSMTKSMDCTNTTRTPEEYMYTEACTVP